MKIEITSYCHGLLDKTRLSLTKEIINDSTSDLILFSGHTIGFVNDIETLKTDIDNIQTEAILELQNINSDKIDNCLYRVTNGKLISLNTNQIFTQSSEIEGNYELAARLLHEFETNRIIKIKGYTIMIIQCGEINILKNFQSEKNRVEFRFLDDHSLNERFNKLINSTDIFLNPIHTPMGNQAKMQKRREYFSKDKRYYFSTSNTREDSKDLKLKSLQYALFDEKLITAIDEQITDYSIRRIYEI